MGRPELLLLSRTGVRGPGARCERIPGMTRVAAIDCGTNTIRLLIADARVAPGGAVRLVPLVRLNEIVRLGQGVDRTGRLNKATLKRTLAVVQMLLEIYNDR